MWHRLFLILILLDTTAASAKSMRRLWIPEAQAPEFGICRFETEQQFVPMQKSTQQYDYSMGIGCHAYRLWRFDFEAGADFEQASDIQATSITDPLQGFVRAVYASGPDANFRAAIGLDGYGLKSGQNDFQIAYTVFDGRMDGWGFILGAFQGMTNTLRSFDGEKSVAGGLASVRGYIGKATFGLDFWSGKHRYGYISLGGHYQMTDSFAFTLAALFANDRAQQADRLLLRLVFSQ